MYSHQPSAHPSVSQNSIYILITDKNVKVALKELINIFVKLQYESYLAGKTVILMFDPNTLASV